MPNTNFKQGEVKCASCGKKGNKAAMWSPPSTMRYCHQTVDCMAIMADIIKKKKQLAEAKKVRARAAELKKGNEPRLKLYGRLADLTQQYSKHIEYYGEPCYTCGKAQNIGVDRGGAFHSGHYIPANRVDPRRFMLCNQRLQCFRCNRKLSGNQAVYRIRLIEEKGLGFVEWLEQEKNHKPLIEVYPTRDDIKKDIAEMREKIKAAGLSPRT